MSEALRYAILWDLDSGIDILPCGFVIDRGDHVQVRMAAEGNAGIRERWDGPLEELQPDGSNESLTPADPAYFNRVLATLFRSFAVTVPALCDEHVQQLKESLRAAPMPPRESVLSKDEWEERYGEWWHDHASERALVWRHYEPKGEG